MYHSIGIGEDLYIPGCNVKSPYNERPVRMDFLNDRAYSQGSSEIRADESKGGHIIVRPGYALLEVSPAQGIPHIQEKSLVSMLLEHSRHGHISM